jgi:hypothetical protein
MFKYLRFFHYSNTTMAKVIPTQYLLVDNEIIIQKDTLVMNDFDTFTVYDIKSSLEPKGIINRVFSLGQLPIIMVLP